MMSLDTSQSRKLALDLALDSLPRFPSTFANVVVSRFVDVPPT